MNNIPNHLIVFEEFLLINEFALKYRRIVNQRLVHFFPLLNMAFVCFGSSKLIFGVFYFEIDFMAICGFYEEVKIRSTSLFAIYIRNFLKSCTFNRPPLFVWVNDIKYILEFFLAN